MSHTSVFEHTENSPLSSINALVLSGGGAKGIAHLGALHEAFAHGLSWKNIKVASGASIGYIILCLMCCGFDPMELFIIMYRMERFFSREDCNSFMTIVSSLTVMDVQAMRHKLEDIIKRKLDDIPTLSELYELSGVYLIASVVNEDKGQVEYKSYLTDPNLSCIDAMLMTSSLPIAFPAFKYNGYEYVDGGLLDNMPAKIIDDMPEHYQTLAICVSMKFEESTNRYITPFEKRIRVMLMPVSEISKLRLHFLSPRVMILYIDVPDVATLQFHMSSEVKMQTFMCGITAVQTFNLSIPATSKDTIVDPPDLNVQAAVLIDIAKGMERSGVPDRKEGMERNDIPKDISLPNHNETIEKDLVKHSDDNIIEPNQLDKDGTSSHERDDVSSHEKDNTPFIQNTDVLQ